MSGGAYNINNLADDIAATTGQNIGSVVGKGLFKTKEGNSLQFKKLVEGSNISITEDEDNLVLSFSGSVAGQNHSDLLGRDLDNSHPISAITGLQSALDSKANTSHVHSAADITTGTLGVNRGGTGISSLTTGNYLRASGTTAFEQRTPAQVRGDIGAAASSHTHIISNITGLQTALDGKADIAHSHTISNVSGLQTALDGKLGGAVNLGSGTPLSSGKDGTNLQLRSLVAGSNVSLTGSFNEVRIDVDGLLPLSGGTLTDSINMSGADTSINWSNYKQYAGGHGNATTANEVLRIANVKALGNFRNIFIVGTVVGQSGSSVVTSEFNITLRSETLPTKILRVVNNTRTNNTNLNFNIFVYNDTTQDEVVICASPTNSINNISFDFKVYTRAVYPDNILTVVNSKQVFTPTANHTLIAPTDVTEAMPNVNLSAKSFSGDGSGLTNVGNYVSVKDFGAVGDGTTDDTAAFQQAFNQSNTRAIFIPAGRYRINSDLSAATRLVLLGESRSHTVLEFFGNARIVFTAGTQDTVDTRGQLILKDIQFRTRSAAQVSAFECAWTGGIGGTSYTVTAEDCDFVGFNSQTGWKWAFDLTNARNTSFRNIRVMGDRGVTAVNGGIKAEGGFRFKGDQAGVEHKLLHCQVYFVKDAFSLQDTTEGVYITDCAAIKCLNGIIANSNNPNDAEPLVTIKGFHANVIQYGVWLTNFVQTFIANSLIYLHADYDSFFAPSVQCGVRIDGTFSTCNISMHDNEIQRITGLYESTPQYAVWLASGRDIMVHDNFLRNFTRGVVLGEGIINYRIYDNIYQGVQYNIGSVSSTTTAKEKLTPVVFTHIATMPTSGTSGRIDIPVPFGSLHNKAVTVVITPASNPNGAQFYYGFDDTQSTTTNLSIRVTKPTSFIGEAVRLSIMASEQV